MPGHRELDRLVFDAAEVADEMGADQLRRAPCLAACELFERGALSGIGRFVDDDPEDPVAVGHDLARTQYEGEFAAIEADAAELAVIDAKDEHRVAIVVGHRALRV